MTKTFIEWEGQVVDSQFCLLRHLASSEDSAVFLTNYGAPQPRNAAIKLVQEDPASAASQLARWELAAKLSHPNLISLFHFGRCQLNSTGLLYVVMEYADEDLSHVLPHRPLTGTEAREMLDAALSALAYLHRKGFVHGHLKPANIMGVGDRVKISTDGVYQGESKEERGILKLYDPPELATGAASPAGDVWSLGATLVEALTQDLPRWQDVHDDPILPNTVPAPFLDIAQQCLRRDPERRWTVAEIAARLQQISRTPEEQRRESSLPALARRRYIVPAAAVGLALVAIVVGQSLVKPRQSIQRTVPSPVQQPIAQEPGKPVPTPSPLRPEAERATPSSGADAGAGEVVKQVLPNVPTKARASIQGRVKVSVRVRVDPSGSVVDARLDSPGPSKYFANLAMQAARRWKFRPVKSDGGDVLNEWIVRFEFLSNSTKALASRVGS